MNVLDAVLDELADRIAGRILAVRERETYSSGALPPRVSRRRFVEVCRSGCVANSERFMADERRRVVRRASA